MEAVLPSESRELDKLVEADGKTLPEEEAYNEEVWAAGVKVEMKFSRSCGSSGGFRGKMSVESG